MRVLVLALALAPLPALACGMPAYKRLDVALADVDAAMEAPKVEVVQVKPAPVQQKAEPARPAEEKPPVIPEVAQAEPRS